MEGVESLAGFLRKLRDLRVRDDRVDESEREHVAVAVAVSTALVLGTVGEEEEVAPAEPVGGPEQQAREREVVTRVGEHAQPGEHVEDLGACPEAAEGVY